MGRLFPKKVFRLTIKRIVIDMNGRSEKIFTPTIAHIVAL